MAKKFLLVDDLDGTEAEYSVVVSLTARKVGSDGELGETVSEDRVGLDLSDTNLKKLQTALKKYFDGGSEVVAPVQRRGPDPQAAEDNRNARAWALKNKHDVNARGIVKKEIVDKWISAGRPVVDE